MSVDYNAAVKLTAQFTGQAEIDKAKKALHGVHDEAEGLGSQLKELAAEGLKELAAAFAVEKIFEFGAELVETGKKLEELSQKTGISVEVLDGLTVAAARAGIPIDGVTTAMKKFGTSSTDAVNGSQAAIAAFKNIGVSVGQIKNSSPAEALQLVIDKFSKLEDGPAKSAAAVKIFGRAGSELIPLLNEGSEALEKFGLGIGDDFAGRAKQFSETLFDLGTQTKKLGVSVLSELLPTLQEVANAFKDNTGTSNNALTFVDYLGEGLRLLAFTAKDLAHDFTVGFDAIITVIQAAGEALAYFASNTVDAISSLGGQAKALLTGNAEENQKIVQEFAQRQADRDKLYEDEKDKRADAFQARTLQRNEELAASEAKLKKNSLLLGDGTPEQIKARSRADTKPEEKEKGTGKVGNNSDETKKEADAIEKYRIEQEKLIQSQYDALDAVDMTNVDYKKLTETRKLEAEEQKRGVGFTKEAKDSLHQVTLELIDQNLVLIELQQAQKESFGQGAKEALHDYLENTKDVAAQTKNLFTHAFTGMEDALVSFVQTGKLSFSSLATSIEADLLRIAAKQAIVGAIGSITSALAGGATSGATSSGVIRSGGTIPAFANGGIMTEFGSLPLNKYANGGIANTPQAAIFGEGAMAEAYVPLPDGRSIPVTMKNGSGGTSVSIVINNNGDGTATGDSAASNSQGVSFAKTVQAMIINEIVRQQRPGGALT